MDKLRRKHGPGTVFIFASDDFHWVNKYFGNVNDVYPTNKHILKWQDKATFDFATLSRCNHSIITQATVYFKTTYIYL